MAYDGAGHLYYTLSGSDNHIYQIDTSGRSLASCDVGVQTGALSWDSIRGMLWAGTYDGSGKVYLVNFGSCTKTYAFTFNDITNPQGFGQLIDGLAYDAIDDTLWLSSDEGVRVFHKQVNGTAITDWPTDIGGGVSISNSGIAVQGNALWLGHQTGILPGPASNEIYKFTKTGSYTGISFSAAGDPEGLALQPSYTPPAGGPTCVLWSNNASNTSNTIVAYNLEASGACNESALVACKFVIPTVGSAAVTGDVKGSGCSNVTIAIQNPNPWWTEYELSPASGGSLTYSPVGGSLNLYAQYGLLPPNSLLGPGSVDYTASFTTLNDVLKASVAPGGFSDHKDRQQLARDLNIIQLIINVAGGSPSLASKALVENVPEVLTTIGQLVGPGDEFNNLMNSGQPLTYAEVNGDVIAFLSNKTHVDLVKDMFLKIGLNSLATALVEVAVTVVKDVTRGLLADVPYVGQIIAVYSILGQPIRDFLGSYGKQASGSVGFLAMPALSPGALQNIVNCFKSQQPIGSGGYAHNFLQCG